MTTSTTNLCRSMLHTKTITLLNILYHPTTPRLGWLTSRSPRSRTRACQKCRTRWRSRWTSTPKSCWRRWGSLSTTRTQAVLKTNQCRLSKTRWPMTSRSSRPMSTRRRRWSESATRNSVSVNITIPFSSNNNTSHLNTELAQCIKS